MTSRIRPFFCLLLALALVIGAQGQAGARLTPLGMAGTGMVVELCLDGRAVSLWVGGEGAPAPAPRHCPDCLAALGPALLPVAVAARGGAPARPAAPPRACVPAPAPGAAAYAARAPPLAV